jgi:hypothetical protein
METGDPNIDDPDRRAVMEATFKYAPDNTSSRNVGLGIKNEMFAWASIGTDGGLETSVNMGSPNEVKPPAEPRSSIFGVHGHVNEGKTFCCDANRNLARASTGGPSKPDREIAKKSRSPTYVVGRDKIWRVDPKTAKITTFERWKTGDQ